MSTKAQREAEAKAKAEAEAKAAAEKETSEVSVTPSEPAQSEEAAANVVESPMEDEDDKGAAQYENTVAPAQVDEDGETFTLSLRVKNNKKGGTYRLLDLVINGHDFKDYSLTQAQYIDLLGEGPRHYIECENHDLEKAAKDYKKELNEKRAASDAANTAAEKEDAESIAALRSK